MHYITGNYISLLSSVIIDTIIKNTASTKRCSSTSLSSSSSYIVQQNTYFCNFSYVKFTVSITFFTQTNSFNSKQIIRIVKFKELLVTCKWIISDLSTFSYWRALYLWDSALLLGPVTFNTLKKWILFVKIRLRLQLNKQLRLFAYYLDDVRPFSIFIHVLLYLNPRTLALFIN